MKRVFTFGLILAFVLPFVAHTLTIDELKAQIAAVTAQIAALQGAPSASPTSFQCPIFFRTLAKGSRGEDVRALQLFLTHEKYFSEEATGYFGSLTAASVARWQADYRVTGVFDASGSGTVGPKTRAAISARCERVKGEVAAAATSTNPLCSKAPPTTPCNGTWNGTRLPNGCYSAWRCVATPLVNTAPRIVGVDGPSELQPGALGRFVIRAEDPGDTLEYRVVWGDASTAATMLEVIANTVNYQRSNTLTHEYTSVGYYTATAYVRDSKGLEARTTFAVRVAADSAECTTCTAPEEPVEPVAPEPIQIQVPQGITACVTPWKGTIVRSGSSVMSEEYFKGSVATPSLMQCMNGAWQRCESDATNCSAHILPAKNLSMTGLQRYSEAIGAGCSGNGGRVVIAEPRTLLCANLIHQVTESTLCAYTQEDTAISLTCNYNNWGEVLTLH